MDAVSSRCKEVIEDSGDVYSAIESEAERYIQEDFDMSDDEYISETIAQKASDIIKNMVKNIKIVIGD